MIGPLKIIFDPLFLETYLQKYDGYVEIIFIIIYTLITDVKSTIFKQRDRVIF